MLRLICLLEGSVARHPYNFTEMYDQKFVLSQKIVVMWGGVFLADQETRTEWDVSPLHWFKSLGNTRATWEICESTHWGMFTFKGGFLAPGMEHRDSHLRHMPAGCCWCWFGVHSTNNSTQADIRHRSFSVLFPVIVRDCWMGFRMHFTCFVIL